MGDLWVVPVKELVDCQLPVATDHELLNPVDDLNIASLRHQAKAGATDLAQILLERGGLGVRSGEGSCSRTTPSTRPR